MSEFKKYKRTNVAEMRPVTGQDTKLTLINNGISISDQDLRNGSPLQRDMIARNPNDHEDQWLVAKQYFEDNFEEAINSSNNLISIDQKIELSKRFYLPGVIIKHTCEKCNNKLEFDLGQDYLSYPETNNPENIYFCCDKCDTEYEKQIIICIQVEEI